MTNDRRRDGTSKQPAAPAIRVGKRPTTPDDASTKAPSTRKGAATRRAILDAALELFAERGFHRTTVPAIVEAAGVGHGTFYDYFDSRRDVLMSLMEDARSKASERARIAPDTVVERIRLELMWYLASYVENRNLYKVWEEAAVFDPEIREQHRKQREVRLARVQRGIAAISPRDDLDQRVAAAALNGMLETFAYRWFVLGDGDGASPSSVFDAAQTLAAMWISAIGAEDSAARA